MCMVTTTHKLPADSLHSNAIMQLVAHQVPHSAISEGFTALCEYDPVLRSQALLSGVHMPSSILIMNVREGGRSVYE